MTDKLKTGVFTLPLLSLFLAASCGSQPIHPNQINAFDGTTYDSLTLAHGALSSLRVEVSSRYPKYAPILNEAEAAYRVAFNSYSAFRSNPNNQAETAVELNNLTISIIALENAFQAGMQVSPATVVRVQKKAEKMRRAIGGRVSVSDILTELEIAAALAQTIPAAQPEAALAQVIIASTSQALAAEIAATGQPIDLTTIEPLTAIQ